MRYLLLGLCLIFGLGTSSAQNGKNTLSSNADSDPKAKAILEKMRDKYEAYSTLEVEFAIDIKSPEQPAEKQAINFKKKGEAYRVEMAGNTVISDGKTLWMVLDRNKEVQINNVPDAADDDVILSPASLFSLYEKDNFAYYLIGQVTENGKVVHKIEFKPLDTDADYSKLRLTLEKGSNEFVSVMAFGKDGTRYTITANKISPNQSLASSLFTFTKETYPGYHVEDLRY
jgi:outer membrane lipoprotein-sorting protein